MMIEKSIIERIESIFKVLDSDNEEGFGITASGYRISITKRDQDMWLDIMDIKILCSERKLIPNNEIDTTFITESIQSMIELMEEYVANSKVKLAESLSVSYCAYCGSSLEDPEKKIQVERYIEHLTS